MLRFFYLIVRDASGCQATSRWVTGLLYRGYGPNSEAIGVHMIIVANKLQSQRSYKVFIGRWGDESLRPA